MPYADLLKPEASQQTLLKWQKTVDLMAKIFSAPAAFVVQKKEDGFAVMIASDQEENPYPAGGFIPQETNIFCKHVVANNRNLYEQHASVNYQWDDNPEVANDGFESYLGVPIHWPNGKSFGTLCVMDFKPTNYGAPLVEFIEHLRDMLEDDLVMIERYSKIKAIAMQDPLTKVLNRRATEILGEHKRDIALKLGGALYCVFLDLDGFKPINDSYGHEVGDLVLQSLAEALKAASSEDDIIGRYGGDEFLAIVQRDNEKAVNDFIFQSEANFYQALKEKKLPKCGFSAGFAKCENKFESMASLFSRADKHMYQQKLS
ncbi:sensor domain-containing diguanylate cyclase [Pseudoalteromonas piscicida]|uniref:sensor domain-containing diguanylate cyclase n=1 Tax=Pseudoalteromonas piscicida TaxID=43662 RepID=UPI0027E586AA|nr:sensor domain-containing diguanylate cyclase [Pseudoalteromonas piscicida]WMO14633.1 sensor domain-containing diguanylate cyclase [Pseudoalteromonas piscicida]